jgi:alcohol dehydrogenase
MAKRKIAYPVFRQPSHVTFGTGSARTLADPEVADGAVFLISSAPGVRAALERAFAKYDSEFAERAVLEKPAGEPTREAIQVGAEWLMERPPARIVAVGGGSVLDWARLAGAAAGGWLDPDAGQTRQPAAAWTRPELVLVPTTCGSGAEAAGVAVYTLNGQKRPVVSPSFVADRVVLDADFLGGFDATTIAPFLCDALSHAIEAFVSIVPNPLAKHAAAAALPVILDHHALGDHCSRERLMEAGYLGGVAASNCSVGVVHAFAHALAGDGVAHGVANGLGLRAGLAANAPTSEMDALLSRTKYGSVAALQEAIAPVVSIVLSSGPAHRVRTLLGNRPARDRILASMEADVCLRTNPRRLQRDDLEAFLDRVAGDIQT